MYVTTSHTPQRSRYLRRSALPLPLVLIRRRGMGDVTNQSIASAAAAGATATTSILVAMGKIGGPVGAAIAGLVAVGMALTKVFSGCGQTCVQATQIANQVGDILQQNLDHYLSAPVHYASLQAAAVNNFQTAWNALVQNCSNPALQAAGQRCVTDRQRGACTWKASPGGWTQGQDGTWTFVPAGPSGSGTECWNWFIGLLDPILNDPTVVPDPVPGSSTASGLLSDIGVDPSMTIAGIPLSDLALPAALVLAWMLLS